MKRAIEAVTSFYCSDMERMTTDATIKAIQASRRQSSSASTSNIMSNPAVHKVIQEIVGMITAFKDMHDEQSQPEATPKSPPAAGCPPPQSPPPPPLPKSPSPALPPAVSTSAAPPQVMVENVCVPNVDVEGVVSQVVEDVNSLYDSSDDYSSIFKDVLVNGGAKCSLNVGATQGDVVFVSTFMRKYGSFMRTMPKLHQEVVDFCFVDEHDSGLLK